VQQEELVLKQAVSFLSALIIPPSFVSHAPVYLCRARIWQSSGLFSPPISMLTSKLILQISDSPLVMGVTLLKFPRPAGSLLYHSSGSICGGPFEVKHTTIEGTLVDDRPIQ
jgi:hypothetical protein